METCQVSNLTKTPPAGMLAQYGGIMTTKPSHYLWIVLLSLLTACGNSSQAAEITKVQNTALAMARTGIALTQTAMPTATPTNTPTALPTATTTPTLEPTFPSPPIFTPDAIQVKRWKEYQTELAKALFLHALKNWTGTDPEMYKDVNVICEWDILGQSGEELYVWAECITGDELDLAENPSVVYLEQDGSIKKVYVAEAGTDRLTQLAAYDLHLFPIDVQKKLCFYYFFGSVPQCSDIVPGYLSGGQKPREEALFWHLKYRKIHMDVPPLVVLSAMLTSTPTP
jgi:hypothetical protein